jgi:hypothetical protein
MGHVGRKGCARPRRRDGSSRSYGRSLDGSWPNRSRRCDGRYWTSRSGVYSPRSDRSSRSHRPGRGCIDGSGSDRTSRSRRSYRTDWSGIYRSRANWTCRSDRPQG